MKTGIFLVSLKSFFHVLRFLDQAWGGGGRHILELSLYNVTFKASLVYIEFQDPVSSNKNKIQTPKPKTHICLRCVRTLSSSSQHKRKEIYLPYSFVPTQTHLPSLVAQELLLRKFQWSSWSTNHCETTNEK